MGASQSATGGFRIFRLQPGGPASQAGLQVFFDYIIEVGGKPMAPYHQVFVDAIKEHENTTVKLVVYSALSQSLRDVYLTPQVWNAEGTGGLLGCTVRWDAFEEAEKQSCRVLDVFEGSPAAAAGLEPYTDYLLGTTGGVCITGIEDVKQLLVENPQGLQFLVYSSATQQVRAADLVPSSSWGGQGILGADLGVGVMHRIPITAPPEVPSRARWGSPVAESASPDRSPTGGVMESPQAVPRPPPCTPLAARSSGDDLPSFSPDGQPVA